MHDSHVLHIVLVLLQPLVASFHVLIHPKLLVLHILFLIRCSLNGNTGFLPNFLPQTEKH